METMKLTFVNVGYGEAVVAQCPDPSRQDGCFVLVIDGGSALAGEYAFRDSGRRPMADYLTAAGIGHIDCMVNTHIHEDHTCGLLAVAEKFPPAELWQTLPVDFFHTHMHILDDSRGTTDSQRNFMRSLNDYQRLCELVKRRGGTVRRLCAGESFALCRDLTCRVLSPSAEKADELESRCHDLFAEKDPAAFWRKLDALDARMNNFSLMLRLEYQGTGMLLPGDTNCLGYGQIDPALLRADLFKVGHHGQKDGADAALLEAVQPKAVVCCASSDRRYNSAHPDTLALVRDAGAQMYFSDCPDVPGFTEHVPPHAAVCFAVGPEGALTAEYLPAK
ncbi:ComEC/Rec2 family competence protein [uncultured Oscillibacter sp.]|uniref:ComEC/Rec2 family competence protein n=1 Tax=uncultured Oscillibacter sp. TaxID=876091 RepID=UPI0025FC58DE|nr:MBL fold metallo-hydrolase [uncultured Oscillibacter sp.]